MMMMMTTTTAMMMTTMIMMMIMVMIKTMISAAPHTSRIVTGPAEILFRMEYYELLNRALKSDGILISQGEIMSGYTNQLVCMHLNLACFKGCTKTGTEQYRSFGAQ